MKLIDYGAKIVEQKIVQTNGAKNDEELL